jgi:hypothetical protein
MPKITRVYSPGEVPTQRITFHVSPEEFKRLQAVTKLCRMSHADFCNFAVALACTKLERLYARRNDSQLSLLDLCGETPSFAQVGVNVDALPGQSAPRTISKR